MTGLTSALQATECTRALHTQGPSCRVLAFFIDLDLVSKGRDAAAPDWMPVAITSCQFNPDASVAHLRALMADWIVGSLNPGLGFVFIFCIKVKVVEDFMGIYSEGVPNKGGKVSQRLETGRTSVSCRKEPHGSMMLVTVVDPRPPSLPVQRGRTSQMP